MSLSIGIVGLPNVGKSTLFNALTKKGVPAENYPFCTIDPSVGVVAVPDERLDKLATFSQSAKKIPAAVEFVDIAGLVKGASQGEGLGNAFLSHIREVDAIAEVVRVFKDKNVTHVSGEDLDPMNDVETINLELILADLQTVTKRRGNLVRDIKQNKKEAILEDEELAGAQALLEAGKLAKPVKSLNLLSAKPILYILNNKAGAEKADTTKLLDFIKTSGSEWVAVDAKVEQELSELEQEDKKVFKQELGVEDDGVNDLIKTAYHLLGLMSYFTTGPDETRGWTIKQGSTAPEAGMAIHTDFKDKFIRAEVIAWDKLLEAGSYGNAREHGLLRTEGKDYIVQDGDVIEFKV
jgi:hypothetical protein